MWYKHAITKVDPSGQINIDFPGIKPKKFDIDSLVDFEIDYDDDWEDYTIVAFLKNGRNLGHISFEAPDDSDTAKITFATLNEYPASVGTEKWEQPLNSEDRLKPDMLKELKQAGYDVDESSVSRLKWGIGKRLYEEFKKFIQKNKPNIKFVDGSVHSKEAYNSRNSVFGLPHTAYDPDGSIGHKITENLSPKQREEISKKISNELFTSRFLNSGESEIPPFTFNVKYKLDDIPTEDIEAQKKIPKIDNSPDLFSTASKRIAQESDQEFTSARTSRNIVPSLLTDKKVFKPLGNTNLDLGGGKYNKASEYLLNNYGVVNLVHDKYNRPEEHNRAVEEIIKKDPPKTVTVLNVLNVIKEPIHRLKLIQDAYNYLADDGVAYFQVWDGKGASDTYDPKKLDSWQERRDISSYIPEIKEVFPYVKRVGSYIIARKSPENVV